MAAVEGPEVKLMAESDGSLTQQTYGISASGKEIVKCERNFKLIRQLDHYAARALAVEGKWANFRKVKF
jgi:hypothetical protein